MNVQPRDYQAEARERILATWGVKPWYKGEGETYRSCVLNIPTSSGKTVVAGLVCEAVSHRGKFLYLADRDELCRQPLDKFHRLLGITAALDKADNKASRMSQVVVGSVQTLSRQHRLERFPRDHFQYIFVDEAHRSVEQAKVVTDYFRTAKVCGQTATAFRAKLKDLSAYYETVAFELGLFSLIDQGYIVPLKVLTLPVEIDISDVPQKQGFDGPDYDKEGLHSKILPYYTRIAKMLREHASGRQIVAFLPLIKSSIEFVRICRALGINARHIDGKSEDREELLKGFEQRQFELISCSSLLSTGWDCPPCDCLINLTPTRSAGMWRQKVGRIGRVLPDVIDGIPHANQRRAAIASSAKPDALILDLLFHAERFGLQGPADLVAANVGEKASIGAKLRQGALMDLQDVASDVQAEREQLLKEELLRAAKRRAMHGLVDAALYAAVMRDKELEDYEPTMHWHAGKPTDKQVEFLERHGIDCATVKDKGHASALTTKIFARKQAGLCSFRSLRALEKRAVPGALNYSEEQAYTFLGNDYPFPFGLPAKRSWTLNQVAHSYWDWLADQPWVEEKYPIIWRHLHKIGVVRKPTAV